MSRQPKQKRETQEINLTHVLLETRQPILDRSRGYIQSVHFSPGLLIGASMRLRVLVLFLGAHGRSLGVEPFAGQAVRKNPPAIADDLPRLGVHDFLVSLVGRICEERKWQPLARLLDDVLPGLSPVPHQDPSRISPEGRHVIVGQGRPVCRHASRDYVGWHFRKERRLEFRRISLPCFISLYTLTMPSPPIYLYTYLYSSQSILVIPDFK